MRRIALLAAIVVGLLMLLVVALRRGQETPPPATPPGTETTMAERKSQLELPQAEGIPAPAQLTTRPQETVVAPQGDASPTELPKPSRAAAHFWITVRVYDAAHRLMDPQSVALDVEDEQGVKYDGQATPMMGLWRCNSKSLHDGRYRITASANGYHSRTIEGLLSSSKRVVDANVTLRRSTMLRVRILSDEGGDLEGRLAKEPHHGEPPWPLPSDGAMTVRGFAWDAPVVIAVATREKPNGRLPETCLASLSRFGAGIYRGWGSHYRPLPIDHEEQAPKEDIPPGFAGIIELFEPLPLYVSACVRSTVLDTQLVQPGTEDVTFSVSLDQLRSCFGEVRLRIVDAITDQPIEGCQVNFFDPDTHGDGRSLGAQGTAVFERIPAGPTPLSILAVGHAAISTQIRVEAGQVNDLGTFRMEPAVSIRGTITDANGQPLARPFIGLVPLDEYRPDQRVGPMWSSNRGSITVGGSLFTLATAEDGQFAALNLNRGRYLLRMIYGASGKRDLCFHPLVIDTTGGSVEGLHIQAQAGTPVWVRLDRDAPEDTWVRILDSDHNPARDLDYSRLPPTMPFSLLPGPYTCAVYTNGVEHAKIAFDVGSSPVNVDIPR
jgi:hypothetical protein